MGIGIDGISSYAPPAILTNQELEKIVHTSDEWIRQRTGIITRHISGPDVHSPELMVPPILQLLAEKQTNIADYNALMVATSWPRESVPLTSDIVAQLVGAPYDLLAMDFNAECASFCWALGAAYEFMTVNPLFQKVLLATGDATTKFTDYNDRSTCVLFGDAAAAVSISSNPSLEGIIGYGRYSDRRYLDCLSAPLGGTMHFGEGGGKHLLEAIGNLTPPLLEEFCEKHGFGISDIDMIVPHQLNIRITDVVKKRLVKIGLKENAFYDRNTALYGNCSGSGNAMALDTCYREGNLKPGDLVVLITWGAGLKIGIVALRWWLPQIQPAA